ncbi:MAG: hypothetical protein JNJ77_02845 [Planctomycetia bacterium]|nr:hypothetical protein [Planctomycetia bacterium]
MRYALAVVCLIACLGFVVAEDKAVTLEGKVCCAKCELGKEKKCMTVMVTKEKGKEVMYYFDADSNKKFHKDYCSGSTDAKVVAKVSEKDGKKVVAVEKIEKKKD